MTSRSSSDRVAPRPRASLSNDGERNVVIDRFRGALVVLMVIGDYFSGISWTPTFLLHAPDLGLTAADTVATAFVFVIGLNYGPSFFRRARSGLAGAYRHFLLRYLSLVGIGAIISAGSNLAGQPSDWGVLQALGVAGLLTLTVIRLPTWARFVIGAVLLCGYQVVLDLAMTTSVVASVHGGLFGAISWAALLIVATAVADVWRKGRLYYVLCCAALVAVASVALLLVPLSKHRVSVSFGLLTLALSAVVFLLIEWLSRWVSTRRGVLSWWGEHALALYLIHLLLLALVVAPPMAWWYVQVPVWLAVVQIVVLLALMTVAAGLMRARRGA